MKNLIVKGLFGLIILSLIGCVNSSFDNMKLKLANPKNMNKIGEYPDNYISIINNNQELTELPFIKPTPYVTKNDIYGWLVCSKNKNSNRMNLFIINNNKIVDSGNDSEQNVINTCNYVSKNNVYYNNEKDINDYSLFLENKKQEKRKFIENPNNEYLFGSIPNEQEIKKAFEKFSYIALKDPDSTIFNVEEIFKHINDNLNTDDKYQYVIVGNFNSKNSYGAYTGYKKIFLVMKNGKLINFYM